MRFINLLLAFCLINTTGIVAQSSIPPELQKKWDEESAVHPNPVVFYKPGPIPDRITVLPMADNAGEIAVTWRTDTSCKEGIIQFSSADGILFANDKKKARSAYTLVQYKDYPMHYHKAIIKGLRAGTTYQYRVGNGAIWSDWKIYRHSGFKDTINLLYFGDAQNGIYDYASKFYKQSFKASPDADLVIHAGDLINHANNDYEWAEWHAATGIVNQTIPVLAAPGNHEYLKNLEGHKIQMSAYWNPTFPYAYAWEQGPYFLDFGFIRFIVLNSNEALDKQGLWLDSLLSKTDKDWVFILSHHPVFSGAKNRQNKGLQENWLPVMEKYKNKIGLVLAGHDHTYARGGLEARNRNVRRPSQPVFVVAVTGDKYYPLQKQSWMDVSYDKVSSYQTISVTKNKILYKAFSETNMLIDTFEIVKGK
ncbi:MAG: metallophosphoesterase family protein [Niabella sp.]